MFFILVISILSKPSLITYNNCSYSKNSVLLTHGLNVNLKESNVNNLTELSY